MNLTKHSEEIHPACRIFGELVIILHGLLFEIERSAGKSFLLLYHKGPLSIITKGGGHFVKENFTGSN
jgi:hypothetical protein